MTTHKKRRFQNLFGQCFLPCNGQLTPQELRKQHIDQSNITDSVQRRRTRQENESIPRPTRSLSCHLPSNQLNNRPYTINDPAIWYHQVKEQDQKTRNYSLESNNHSSTLATGKSKTDKPPSALSNKIYYVINNDKTPAKSNRSTGINITPLEDSKTTPNRKPQSSVTLNKTQTSTRAPYSKHERPSCRTSPVVKNTPPRVPTTTNTRSTNQKPVPLPSTTNKSSPRPRYTLSKPSEPARTVGTTSTRPRSAQTTPNKSNISPTKPIKTRPPIVSRPAARATDLDKVMAEQQKTLPTKPTIISPSNLIQPTLFSKDNVKLVRPVRSQELKIFSCHLTPEMPSQTNESLSTLTPSSYESIHDHPSQVSGVRRDFSEDSLNEHFHIQKLLEQNSTSGIIPISSNSTSDGYLPPVHDELNAPYAPPSSLTKPQPTPSSVHRLVFPERLGRLIFYRRILSDSDLYQKNCSKENEIVHNVYHLDTVRDYSMEFYMLSSYASDSQLRAWLDDDDADEIIGQYNEHRFLSSDEDEIDKNPNKSQQEELDWYSELELLNATNVDKHEYTSSTSSDIPIEDYLRVQQTFSDSSNSWTTPSGASNPLHSTPIPSDPSNSILREILNHSWTNHLSRSNSIEQLENDSTSSILTEEFQPDFYYLCPITKTTSFSTTDSKT